MQRRRLQGGNVRRLLSGRKCRGLELRGLRGCRCWLRSLRLSCEGRGKPWVQPHRGHAEKKTRDSSNHENRRAAQNFLQKSTLLGCYPAPISACQLLAVISPSFGAADSAGRSRGCLNFGADPFLPSSEDLLPVPLHSVLVFPPCAKYFSSPL
jgi:hypothetical protein